MKAFFMENQVTRGLTDERFEFSNIYIKLSS